MQISQKGQVTIPQEIRERFGLMPYTQVEFIIKDNQVILRKKRDGSPLKRIRGIAKGQFTTKEIMDLTRK